MAFSYSGGVITQTGTETGNDQLAGLSGLTGVTTTTLGERTVYSIDSSTRIIFNGTCVIDPRYCELETNRLGGSGVVVNGTLDLGLEISYTYGAQYTSGRALNILGGSNVPWGAIFEVTGTLNWYGCEIETGSGIRINAGGLIKIRDGVFISRLGDHTILQGTTIVFETGSTADIIGLKKTLTGLLEKDNSAVNILGVFTTVNLSGIISTGGISPDNRSSTLAPVPFATVSNFQRIEDAIAQCRTVLAHFDDCASWDTASPVFLGLRAEFGTVTRYGQAEFYRNCNGRILFNGSGLQGVKLYWKDIDNGGRGVTTATEWGQTYNSFREYTATTDANGQVTIRVLEAAFYNTNPSQGAGTSPAVDDRTESDHKITFKGYKYGYSFFDIQFQGNRIVSAEATQPVIADANITESNKATVDAYTTIETPAKFYDRASAYVEDNFSTIQTPLLTRSGNEIDAGAFDIVIDATAASAFAFDGTTVTIKASVYTGDMTTTGIITLANGAEFIGTRTDANGTIVPPNAVSVTNITAGSRIQIYNVTTDTEVVNQIVAGASYTTTYEEGADYSEGDIIRVRLTYANTTTAKLSYQVTAIAGATGWAALADQVNDEIYITFGIDGSSITQFTADYLTDQVDVVVGANFNLSSFYAWWAYNLTTEDGIRDFFGGITAEDQSNFRINTAVLSLFLDNSTNTNIRQLDNRRFYRSDGAYPVLDPTSGGGGIDIVWRNQIFIADISKVESDLAIINNGVKKASLLIPHTEDI